MPASLHLTFDDGPEPQGTPHVLEALAAASALATFFVLGAQVRKAPAILDDIRAAGHRVELHGDAHLDHRKASLPQLVHDTGQAITTLADHGVMPQWWRLPWGQPGPGTGPLAAGLGLRVVGWDADTHDWRGDRWAGQPGHVRGAAASGGVVLMHDGFGPGATRASVKNTVDLIHGLAAAAAESGSVLAALPDAFSSDAFGFTARAGHDEPSGIQVSP